jgi:hypothetical protein
MRNPILSAAAAKKSPQPADAPMRWVCLALGLSILVLALRIASVW